MGTERILPNFLIVGAARAGTTSTYRWLRQHPDVFMPRNKEPTYFRHRRLPDHVRNLEEYLRLFRRGNGKRIVGEASAAYFAAPEAPEWIARTLPGVKVLILLRDPAERINSLYHYRLAEGLEWRPTLERVLEDERKSAPWPSPFWRLWGIRYVPYGFHHDNVKRYFDHLGAGTVRVHLFDDLVERPDRVYEDLCGFLGISAEFRPNFSRENESRIPRLRRLQPLLREHIEGGGRIPGYWHLFRRLMKFNAALGRGKKPLGERTRNQLQGIYREDILRLADLIQRDLSGWLRPR